MRTLSAAMIAEYGLDVIRPGYFIEIMFSTPVRWSTFEDVDWNGVDWLARDIKVSELSQDMNGVDNCTLDIGNGDGAAGALALGEKFSGKAIRVWAVYAGATDDDDAAEVYRGECDGAKTGARVIVETTRGQRTRCCPRKFINRGIGLSCIQPVGHRIPWGSAVFVLARPRV